MSPQEFRKQFEAGNRLIQPEGLIWRVVWGKRFQRLAESERRRLVMVGDSRDLASLAGLTGYETMMALGYELEYLAYLLASGNQFKLIVFPARVEHLWATWDNTCQAVSVAYVDQPEVGRRLEQWRQELGRLTRHDFDSLEQESGYRWLDVVEAGMSDPRFLTLERFLAGPDTLLNIRAFLYFELHLRKLFEGDGRTYDGKGNPGINEYYTANARLQDLDCEMIDLEVRLPDGP